MTTPPKTSKHSFHEPQPDEEIAMPSDRATGLVFAAVAVIVAVIGRNHHIVLGIAGASAVLLVITALAWPTLLAPLNRVWFRFGLLLNRIVSPVVMFILFAVTIVPYGLAMQRLRDPLRKSRAPDGVSYWIERKTTAGSMRQQF